MLQFDFRISGGRFHHYLAPEHGRFQHILLVHRAKPFTPLHGDPESRVGDTADLRLRVAQRVDPHAFARLCSTDAPGLGEIDAAGQFAHDHDIQSADQFRFERRGSHQLRVGERRPQVGKQGQFRAQGQQRAAFGP